MAIDFSCVCGKKFTVNDDLAGKRSKCPACRSPLTVPAFPEDDGFEVVDDGPEPESGQEQADDEIVMEVVETPAASTAPAAAAAAAKPADKADGNPFDFSKPGKNKKKKKKKKKSQREDEEEGSMAAMYMAEAREQERKDEARAKASGDWGDGYEGRTIFGIHFTGAVVGGASMLVIGLISMAAIFILRENLEKNYMRAFIGAIVCTGLGLLQLARGFMGESED